MMGPEPGSVPRGCMLDSSRYPMPHPESKVRPRQAYGDSAVLSHMAHVNKTYLAGFKSDGRHMFFQFEMSPEEERTCSFATIIPFPLLDDGGKPVLDEKGNAIGAGDDGGVERRQCRGARQLASRLWPMEPSHVAHGAVAHGHGSVACITHGGVADGPWTRR